MSNSNTDRTTSGWMSISDLEARLSGGSHCGSLTETVRRVNDKISDDLVRNRQREAADFADAQNQIVGHEVRR
ncbi:hypothetical protein LOC67_15250 [Stieleria sp. JC731]|uniref:hypothetical protein n=1 Tax=Pirellulaceae TaxID=2691357 RepID=UPI001E4B12FB|nr:hypothetical protein [Stieleria sp. JC731]MCC9601916.1 hypothetical protein [Stieleria sp. JC731]